MRGSGVQQKRVVVHPTPSCAPSCAPYPVRTLSNVEAFECDIWWTRSSSLQPDKGDESGASGAPFADVRHSASNGIPQTDSNWNCNTILGEMPEPTMKKQNGSNGFDESKAYQAQEEEGTAFVSQLMHLHPHLI